MTPLKYPKQRRKPRRGEMFVGRMRIQLGFCGIFEGEAKNHDKTGWIRFQIFIKLLMKDRIMKSLQ